MRDKAHWKAYIHAIRRREVELALAFFGSARFKSGIEFGAGDGYQTTLLAPHCARFVSSDLNFARFKESLKMPDVRYVKCDADNIGDTFPAGEFDLVFSSSMLEHLGDPAKFLHDTHILLAHGGHAIHIVPTKLAKVGYVLFFYPNVVLLALDRLAGLFRRKKIFRGSDVSLENNIHPVVTPPSAGRFKRLLVPAIHGNYPSHAEEFRRWSRGAWEALFEDAGFEVVACIRGPVYSGYGFGLERMRRAAERLGLHSEYIFILAKP